jgi:hypothetical protein
MNKSGNQPMILDNEKLQEYISTIRERVKERKPQKKDIVIKLGEHEIKQQPKI